MNTFYGCKKYAGKYLETNGMKEKKMMSVHFGSAGATDD